MTAMSDKFEMTSFNDFLRLARRQAEPQQLLFVFTRNELPADATPAQSRAFAAGEGGHLAPVACVDMAPRDISGFEAFASEAEHHVEGWTVVFAASLVGIADRPPTSLAIDQALDQMVETVRMGEVAPYLAFDRSGTTLQLSRAH